MKRAKRLHKTPPAPPKVRNPVARSPLMRKGGVHGKSTAAVRRQANVETRKLARDPASEE
ncbi:MAG: hypothetical protein U1F48_12005 [Burkholderiales bacterium]